MEEEITAQYFGAMTQRAFCEEEVRKNPGLWQKVKDVFKKIVDDIKRKLEMLAKKDLVVKAAMEADIRDVQEAYSIFDSVLRYVQQHGEETENKKAAEEAETIKYSRIIEGSFRDIVHSVLNADEQTVKKNLEEANVIQVMPNTPSVILENVKDAEDLPIIMRYDALYLAGRKEGIIKGHYFP